MSKKFKLKIGSQTISVDTFADTRTAITEYLETLIPKIILEESDGTSGIAISRLGLGIYLDKTVSNFIDSVKLRNYKPRVFATCFNILVDIEANRLTTWVEDQNISKLLAAGYINKRINLNSRIPYGQAIYEITEKGKKFLDDTAANWEKLNPDSVDTCGVLQYILGENRPRFDKAVKAWARLGLLTNNISEMGLPCDYYPTGTTLWLSKKGEVLVKKNLAKTLSEGLVESSKPMVRGSNSYKHTKRLELINRKLVSLVPKAELTILLASARSSYFAQLLGEDPVSK